MIDTTARALLLSALNAAKDAGEPYIPRRNEIAKAVSKSLNYKLGIHSLFATKAVGPNRVPRYPKFQELWKQTRDERAAAKRRLRERYSPDA